MVNGMDTVLQVRRREIRDADLDAVACLLARGFRDGTRAIGARD